MRHAVVPTFALSLVLCGALPVASGWGGPEPTQEQDEKKKERPPIYDEQADAAADIEAALARAKKENKRVLIQWGANWCGWCHLLHDTYTSNKDVKQKLLYEYELVLVDVGRGDKNQELAKRFGTEIKGLPFLTVLDASGKTLANQETGSLEKGKAHDPEKVLAFLTQHQAEHQDADRLLADAKAAAAKDGKRVFLHFGAPWCGWCHRLEAWLERPAVKPLLARDFVDLKLDIDRTKGGKELMNAMCNGATGGVPWIAFLEGDRILAHSGLAQENIGCPWADAEIETFGKLLATTAKSLTAEDIAALLADLRAFRQETEDAAKAKANKGSAAGGAG